LAVAGRFKFNDLLTLAISAKFALKDLSKTFDTSKFLPFDLGAEANINF